MGAREIAQWLGTLIALPRELSLGPIIYVWWLTMPVTPV